MHQNNPAVTGPVDQLVRPADEAHPLVRRLDNMSAGWLCAGLPDAELPAEAAREIERLADELRLCCELKRAYQEQAAAERDRCAAIARSWEKCFSRASSFTASGASCAAGSIAEAIERGA